MGKRVTFGYLDGLRGIAALVVVLDHFAISFFQRSTDASVQVRHAGFEDAVLQTPLHLLVSGNLAVCIFFVLSGFVLSIKFFSTRRRHVVVASAWRRYARLELPVLACVLLGLVLIAAGVLQHHTAAAITGSSWLSDLWNVTPDFFGAIYHATIGIFITGTSQYNTVLWTMQAELFGSFLVFVLLLAGGRAPAHWRWVAYAALVIPLVNSYLLCFVAGVALCDWYSHRTTKPSLKPVIWLPLLAVSLLLGSMPVGTLVGTMFGGVPGWLGQGLDIPARSHIIAAILLVGALVAVPAWQRVLCWRPLIYLGRVSFGLYLTHLLVLGTISCWLFVKLEPSLGYVPAFAVMFAVSLPLILLVAHAFTQLVDRPAIRFSALLYRWLFPRRLRPSVRAESVTSPG
ncbi:MAG TPA: acyltransferase [Nitrosospira sp.]|jgi:peptidoglycan/LPS O-acetylase OafA/YrhL|nr:acyltransferase [Nitrosospira sp.]